MARRECPREAEMLEALGTGRRSEALEAHVAECATCRELEGVARFMREVAALSEEPLRLPDPSYVWWKAQLLRQWEANRRAVAPLDTVNQVEVVAAVVGLVVLLFWQGPALLDWVTGTNAATLWTLAAPIAAPAGAITAVAGILLALTMAVLFRYLVAGD
jgi:hypothetical protein